MCLCLAGARASRGVGLAEAPASPPVHKRRARASRLAGGSAAGAVSLAASVLSWRPFAWAKVAPGLDPSWQAGLAVGFERHLQWGRQVVFTYGPYGLVDTLLPFARLSISLAVLFALATSWGLAALVVCALRPAWGLVPAGVVAWAALAIANSHSGYSDLASAAALGLALVALRTDDAGRRLATLAALGALGGFSLLTKFNDGVVASGLLVVALGAEGAAYGARALGRAAAGAIAAFAGVLAAAWVGAGQSLANLPSYFEGCASVALGYSSAMSLSQGRRAEDFFAVAVLALEALVFYLSALRAPGAGGALGPRAERVRRAALVVSLVGWSWAALKEGFVRHDTHDLTFFGLVLLATGLARLGRRYIGVQAGALAVSASLACVAAGAPPAQLHSPGASTAALATDLRVALGLGGFKPAQASLRARLLAAGDGLPAKAVSLVEGHSVAIEPADAAAAFLYPQLDWDPEPVLQGYSAYTSYLDGLGSKFLASARAPERIVYDPGQVISGRDPWMGPPATLLSMYCHYSQLAAVGAWQVLSRVADRCGPARPVATLRARFGEVVRAPKATGELLAATFSFSLPILSNLEGVLLKPPAIWLQVWPALGDNLGDKLAHKLGRPEAYRFVPGTAADMHVVATPAALGYSSAFTPPALSALELEGGGWAKGQGLVRVKFYALRMARAVN